MISDRPSFLFVHGAWVGAWEFQPVLPALRERGWDATAIDLPSTGSTAGLAEDAAAVTAALDAADGPVIVVAHSYGGVPVSQAGGHPAVERLVYVAAFALDVGESLQSSLGGGLPPFWSVADGQVSLGPSREARIAMVSEDLPPGTPTEAAEALADMFRPQSLRSFQDTLTAAAWHDKPAAYVLTEQDKLVPPPFQRMLAERIAGDIVPMPNGHAPFQEDPLGFIAVLEAIAASTPATA